MDPITMGLAGGAVAAGTGMQLYASDRKRKAVRQAMGEYEAALGGEDARLARNRGADQQDFSRWAGEDVSRAQEGVSGSLAAGDAVTQDPAAFRLQVQQAQARNPAQGLPALSADQQGWARAASAQLAPAVQRDLNQRSREWSTRAADDQRDALMTNQAIQRLMAQRERADVRTRKQLDEAIAQLAWARQQRMLQLKMNQAAGTGAEQAAYGSMLVQAAPAVSSFQRTPTTPATPAGEDL